MVLCCVSSMSWWLLMGKILVSECNCYMGGERRQPVIQPKARLWGFCMSSKFEWDIAGNLAEEQGGFRSGRGICMYMYRYMY